MKLHFSSKRIGLNHASALVVAIAISQFAVAGSTEMAPAVTPAPPADDVVSGVLKLDFYTHFISYGLDVWGDGSSMSDPGFNPMLELAFALPADFTLTLGAWGDIHSKGTSPLGGRIQEIDVWTGLAYTYEKFTVSATYQAWMYNSSTEDILDIKFAYDTFLSPSLTFHNRLDEGGSGGNTGTIAVLGLSHGFDLGPVAFSIPFSLAYFFPDDFHPASTEDGLGYGSLGLAASLPLTPYIGSSLGDWTLNGGLTYYVCDSDVVANADTNDFLVANLGLSLAF